MLRSLMTKTRLKRLLLFTLYASLKKTRLNSKSSLNTVETLIMSCRLTNSQSRSFAAVSSENVLQDDSVNLVVSLFRSVSEYGCAHTLSILKLVARKVCERYQDPFVAL